MDEKSFFNKFLSLITIAFGTFIKVIRHTYKYIIAIIMLILLLDLLMYLNYGIANEDHKQGSVIFGKSIKVNNENVIKLPESSNLHFNENKSIMEAPEDILNQTLCEIDNQIKTIGGENYTGGLIE